MPDSIKVHLPSSMTRSDVYDRMDLELREVDIQPCSKPLFFSKMWKKQYPDIVIPSENRFAKCDKCSKFKEDNKKEISEGKYAKKDLHIQKQNAERRKYYKRIQKAKSKPHKYLSVIIDGMD